MNVKLLKQLQSLRDNTKLLERDSSLLNSQHRVVDSGGSGLLGNKLLTYYRKILQRKFTSMTQRIALVRCHKTKRKENEELIIISYKLTYLNIIFSKFEMDKLLTRCQRYRSLCQQFTKYLILLTRNTTACQFVRD